MTKGETNNLCFVNFKNKVPLVDQVNQALDSKLAIGHSKHQDKLSEVEKREITSKALGHNDIATTRGSILNNQGKEKTKQIVIESLSGMNGIDVLKRTQDLQKEKSLEALIFQDS